jgi:CHAT domain-containing protein
VDTSGVSFVRDLCSSKEVAESLKGIGFQLSKFNLNPECLSGREALLLRGVRYHLFNLYRMLFAPLRPMLRAKSLLVVPHGEAHYVPFHALWDGANYLIDQYDFTYGASTAVLRICRDKPDSIAARDLILAVPDERTPSILDEASVLADLLPNADVFIGEQARARVLRELGPSAGKVHIAAHGVFRSDNPLFSSVRMADSWLSMVDVFSLRLGSELTTLSACETGMSTLCGGDELLGLTQAFLYAGTPSLVVSLWRVNDRSTTLFMKGFYQGLSKGQTKPEALRRAMLDVKAEFPHPYFWAPFILLGKS